MECIYIGSTENLGGRYESHRITYERYPENTLYKIIQGGGGWEGHIFTILEQRETHIGLNVIESIWWESVKPRGNKINPLIH